MLSAGPTRTRGQSELGDVGTSSPKCYRPSSRARVSIESVGLFNLELMIGNRDKTDLFQMLQPIRWAPGWCLSDHIHIIILGMIINNHGA